MFRLTTRLPDARLRPYIKMYFGSSDDHAPHVQRIVPNGEMGICFYRGNEVTYDGIGPIRSCLSGQSVSYQDIVSDGRIDIVGAHFTTLGAALFFNAPLHSLFGAPTPLRVLGDKELDRLEEQIMEAGGYDLCFDLMDRFFLGRIGRTDIDPLNLRRLQRAIAYGQRHTAEARIDDIASEACLSQRHFNRLFTETAGLSPKEYLRLLRYRKALADLKSNRGSATMSEIAWRNGYCDLSHMSADFRKISGYTPAVLLGKSENENDDFGWRI
ncbi:MAG: helix-turn-helix domain-containing protein [Paludibacteraceae bacterium]|nr:helix-turn-helix domain-containing protein [Paludibacteraceae bacterium]MBR6286091.1 helix-turn-helix domain-containing protein [Bacteroidaceae bacterium]